MMPEQRRRAAEAARTRMAELHMSTPKLAAEAGVSPGTIRSLLRGERWPSLETRRQLEGALGWRAGEFSRRAVGSRPVDVVASMSTPEVLELLAACCTILGNRFGRHA